MMPALILLGLLYVVEDKPAAYPNARLLIEPADLVKPGAAARYRILDARSKDKYEKGHLPQAVWVDHDKWSKDYAEAMDESGWERAIGGLGIADDIDVVIYDDDRFNRAARIWWILKASGYSDVQLL